MKKCIFTVSVLFFIFMAGVTCSYAQWWTSSSSGWWSSTSSTSSSSTSTTSSSTSSTSSSSTSSTSSSSGSIEAQIEAGGTIAAGTYTLTRKISISKSGITITATNVILDAKNLTSTSSGDGITISGSNNKLVGITVKNAGHNGISITGNGNTLQNCITHSNKNTGLNIKGSAANNTITGCISYNNYDTQNSGENADGFGVKDCTGSGNKFINCEAYNNSDDGWDFWGTTGAVTVTGCYAHDNGRGTNGDGNGFKLGESGVCGRHVLKDCTAKNNLACGFTKNGNTCTISYTNCVSSGNGKADNR